MSTRDILIVEDEADILELVRYMLEREGFSVRVAESGEEAFKQIRTSLPDLILLDLMLPGMDGHEICRRLRASRDTSETPVIMLTAKGEEQDVVKGLNLGADDYVTKPFSPKVLLARIQAVFRRQGVLEGSEVDEQEIVHGALRIHTGRREVLVSGDEVQLTFTEFQILVLLASRPGWVFTRYQIVDAVRGEDYPVTERAVDVHMVGLRRKLGETGNLIETVRGVGYRFKDEE